MRGASFAETIVGAARRHRAQRREDEYNQKAGHGGLSDGPFVGLRLAVDKF